MTQTDAPQAASTPQEEPTSSGSDRPIFVVGCARSGTTLLQLMLHSHPRIAIPPELRFTIKLYNKRVQIGDLSVKKNRRRVARMIVDREGSFFDDLGLDPEVVRQRIIDGPPTLGSAIGIVLQAYAEKWGKPRWGEKRPNFIQYLPQVLELFPDAQIVHIIRDGRDCAASLKRMPWWNHGHNAAVFKWQHAMHTADWARETLSSDQYYDFRYEDLVSNPEAELRLLCDFLDEDFDPGMLEPAQLSGDAVPERKVWHERTKEPVSGAAVGRWQGELDMSELQLMEWIAGKELKRYGYELTPRLGKPAKVVRREYEDYLERKLAKDQAWTMQDQEKTAEYPWPLGARLTRGQVETG